MQIRFIVRITYISIAERADNDSSTTCPFLHDLPPFAYLSFNFRNANRFRVQLMFAFAYPFALFTAGFIASSSKIDVSQGLVVIVAVVIVEI